MFTFFALSLLLNYKIPSGRGCFYHLSIPITTPGIQNLLINRLTNEAFKQPMQTFFFWSGQEVKRKREYCRTFILCVTGNKNNDTVIVFILKNLVWKNKILSQLCSQIVGQIFHRSTVTFIRLPSSFLSFPIHSRGGGLHSWKYVL